MAGFDGKWRIVNHSNLEAFHKEIKSPEDYKKNVWGLLNSYKTKPDTYIEEFKVDLPGKTVFRKAYVNGEKVRDATIPIAVERDVTGPDGRPYKGTLTMEGDKKIQVHQRGEDFEATLTYELKGGDTFELTLTSGSVSGTETYNRV